MNGLAATCARFQSLPHHSTPHTKGVRYFVPAPGIQSIQGAIDQIAVGSKRGIRIVVRPSRHRPGLHELYTYHIPKAWSAACQANRALQSIARRRAHDLEHNFSREALEYRIRFLSHFFRVVKGGEKPEEGMKAYSRFFHYTYVYILRELYAAQTRQQTQQQEEEEITFEPISGDSRRRNTFFSSSTCICQKKAVILRRKIDLWQRFVQYQRPMAWAE